MASSFVRARRGFTPAPAPLFFASPKKRGEKKGDPDACAPGCARGALRCSKSGPRRKTHCVRVAHSVQTVAPSQSTRRASARGPTLLCSSAWHRGNSKQPNSQQPNTQQTGLTSSLPFSAAGCSAVRAAAPMRCREAQLGWAARASARSPTDSAQLSERSEQRERSEFWAGPAKRASQGTPAKGRGCASGPCSLLPFLHEQERESPAGAKSRRGLSIRT